MDANACYCISLDALLSTISKEGSVKLINYLSSVCCCTFGWEHSCIFNYCTNQDGHYFLLALFFVMEKSTTNNKDSFFHFKFFLLNRKMSWRVGCVYSDRHCRRSSVQAVGVTHSGSISPTCLRKAFACIDLKSAKMTDDLTAFLHFWDLHS